MQYGRQCVQRTTTLKVAEGYRNHWTSALACVCAGEVRRVPKADHDLGNGEGMDRVRCSGVGGGENRGVEARAVRSAVFQEEVGEL